MSDLESIWTVEQIQEVLPQRPPFLFVDKVLEFNKEEATAKCLKNVTINDYYFKGHFPNNPVMPGVIMIEALAQASIILYAILKPEIAKLKPIYYLGKVESKFVNIVRPGDKLILEVSKQKLLDKVGIVNAQAVVDDKVAVKAQITFGVKV